MASVTTDHAIATPSLTHDALLYRTAGEYVADLVPFLQGGLAADESTFVAVPGPKVELLRDALGEDAHAVEFVDMTTVGRNPSRIIPAIRQFVETQPKAAVRFIGEPIWPGRTPTEAREATRHEAMLNVAFADSAVHIRCPYDVSRLDPKVVAESWLTHPLMIDHNGTHDSTKYANPEQLFRGDDRLPRPPADVSIIGIESTNLPEVRHFARRYCAAAGLPARRAQDMVLAANELATNTVVHSGAPGVMRLWRDGDSVICEVRDGGHIADPFAGRYTPDDGAQGGRGLWMANQLCDLVQIRSTEAGTTIRLHVASRDT